MQNNQTTQDLIVSLVLKLALVIFAIYGVTSLAPKVADVLSTRMQKAASIGERPRL